MVSDQLKREIEEALSRATMLQGDDPSVLLIIPRSQAGEFLLATPPQADDGIADIGRGPAAGLEHPPPVVMFDALEIRDTDNHRPTEPVAVMDLRGARNWSFEIFNDHDQDVTVEVIGGSDRTPNGMGLLGVSITISASTTEPIATDVWLPFMSLQLSYAIQPGSGTVTARGYRQLFAR